MFRWLLILAALVATQPSFAQTEKRLALVIGNGAEREARLMADALKAVGFELVGGSARLNLDKPDLERAVRNLGRELPAGGVGFFYYAGSAVALRGTNYLVPAGARLQRDADADVDLLDLGVVLRQMAASGAKLNFVVLDAGGLAQTVVPTER
jgi:uncharacterized caspase-like protein